MTPEQHQTGRAARMQALEAKVDELINKGLNRRAATVCLELIDAAETSSQRQKYSQLRGLLIRTSNRARGNMQTWYLAGNYMGAQ